MTTTLRRLNQVDTRGKVFVGALLHDDWTLPNGWCRVVLSVLRPEHLGAFTGLPRINPWKHKQRSSTQQGVVT
jgi:hypothetical protein